MGQGMSLKSERKIHDLNYVLTFYCTQNQLCVPQHKKYLGYITFLKCKSRDIVANANFILGWKLEYGIDSHNPVCLLWKCSLCIRLVWSLVLSRDRIEHICSLRKNIECLSQLPTPSTNTYNKGRWNQRGKGQYISKQKTNETHSG